MAQTRDADVDVSKPNFAPDYHIIIIIWHLNELIAQFNCIMIMIEVCYHVATKNLDFTP